MGARDGRSTFKRKIWGSRRQKLECQNPFKIRAKKCCSEIAVSIQKDGRMFFICKNCWDVIAKSNLEW